MTPALILHLPQTLLTATDKASARKRYRPFVSSPHVLAGIKQHCQNRIHGPFLLSAGPLATVRSVLAKQKSSEAEISNAKKWVLYLSVFDFSALRIGFDWSPSNGSLRCEQVLYGT